MYAIEPIYCTYVIVYNTDSFFLVVWCQRKCVVNHRHRSFNAKILHAMKVNESLLLSLTPITITMSAVFALFMHMFACVCMCQHKFRSNLWCVDICLSFHMTDWRDCFCSSRMIILYVLLRWKRKHYPSVFAILHVKYGVFFCLSIGVVFLL